MKKTLLLFACLVFIAVFAFVTRDDRKNPEVIKNKQDVLPSPQSPVKSTVQQSLFVPYWSLSGENSDFGEYDRLLYFGIMPAKTGINKEDAGYKRLPAFAELAGNKEKLLVLRMLDSKLNFEILKDSAKQKLIIKETISIAEDNGFDGVVLDLELAALPFDSLIQQINNFNKNFSKTAKNKNLGYSITAYGDTYYRVRPFDVKTLSKSADQVMVMAYDLHKAGGSPGPNFPLSGKKKYGYDYTALIDKVLTEVPAEKITVIFGLFGYDWQVDEKNISQGIGKPLSYLEIQSTILDNCQLLLCISKREANSGEMTIAYTADDGTSHTVWYEDMESVSAKQDYLKSRGIKNFSLWAYSYFE